LSSHKKNRSREDKLKYPFFTEKSIDLIKKYTVPRTDIGMGRYASYKDYGEDIWRIGYGSTTISGRYLLATDKATQEEVDKQFIEDLKEFSNLVKEYVFISLNSNRKAALLSFAYSIGIQSFKVCRLLELINTHASKTKLIREWSPYINRIWQSGGDLMVDRRRMELDTYLSPDKEIPTFTPHRCRTKKCLLNLPETYTGAPNQLKAIEYLEKKFVEWDPSGEVLRRFFRYWSQKPNGQGSLPRPVQNE
jgi:GH24 family phage-related lysozyme (muramidase)